MPSRNPSPPSSAPPQRSTRAPAEGADPRTDIEFDHGAADARTQPPERSPREPAEGRPDPAPGAGQVDHAGSGNTLGDGRTAGGANNASKRDRLPKG